jgi:transposase
MRPNRPGRRWTTDELQKIIGMWLDDKDIAEIAAAFGLTTSGINHLVQRLRRNGIALPLRKRGHKAGRRDKSWTQEEIETLARMIGAGASTQEIANELHRTYYGANAMIQKLRNEEGVALPHRSHGRTRLWDAERLQAAIAGRGLLALEGGKKAQN